VAVADLDGDTVPDLVTANANSDDVSVLLGNGDGTFQAAVSFASGFGLGPVSITVADLDGDSLPDLVVANFFSDDMTVLLGNGDGSFDVDAFLVVGDGPFATAVADLDGDTFADLITANGNSDDVTVTPTPEPGLLLQLASGVLALAMLDKRRRRAND
jgi:hypothetical protein